MQTDTENVKEKDKLVEERVGGSLNLEKGGKGVFSGVLYPSKCHRFYMTQFGQIK